MLGDRLRVGFHYFNNQEDVAAALSTLRDLSEWSMPYGSADPTDMPVGLPARDRGDTSFVKDLATAHSDSVAGHQP